jgi:NAD(P)-dependent dehydrogenase (short-subunit alcohol dehydrogenase family)
MLLNDKQAVIYGAGGHIGSTVARAFARDGATVYLTGRTLPKVAAVAEEIRAAGGAAEAAEVDALDREAIERHLAAVIAKAGRIDVSFNAISIRGDLQGTLLVDMPCDDFTLPVLTAVRTHFLTATAAARHMARRRSGVILTLSSSASVLSGRDRQFHRPGGFSTACAAVEQLTYSLAGELGPQGIRVICLRPDAIPETWPGEPAVDNRDTYIYMTGGTALHHLPTLDEVANAAVFLASDRAGALTGTVANLTCGSVMA